MQNFSNKILQIVKNPFSHHKSQKQSGNPRMMQLRCGLTFLMLASDETKLLQLLHIK